MNAIKCTKEDNYRAITCGHTHYVEDVVINGVMYINGGAWTESPIFYLLANEQEMTLQTIDQ